MKTVPSQDKAPWLLTASVALAFSGMSVLLPRTPAQAQAPRVVMAGITTPAAPADDGDGDGDELLEHWGDAKFRREQRAQLKGMAVLFAGFGTLSLRRRANLRKGRRHG